MKTIALLFLVSCALAADPAAKPETAAPSSAQDAITMLGKLPDPLLTRHLEEWFAGASSEDAARVLMHISIAAIRPARPVVLPMLGHRDPLVVERALRALTAIGLSTSEQRERVEQLLSESQPMVAAQAATCLGSGDDLRAVPALMARMTKGPPEVAGAALGALQRLTRVDFKNDSAAWDAWYQAYRAEANQRLRAQAEQLTHPEPERQIAAIQTLAGMRGERQEAVDLIESMVKASDPAVAMAARQALATLAPTEYTMPSAAEVVAATKPTVVVEAKSQGVMGYLASQGLFDTWYGIALTAFTGILLLSGLLFLLRTGPVKNATRRFGRVVVAGTMSFVRPASARIKSGTKRIVRQFTQTKSDSKKPG
jgi:hypothetical protein